MEARQTYHSRQQNAIDERSPLLQKAKPEQVGIGERPRYTKTSSNSIWSGDHERKEAPIPNNEWGLPTFDMDMRSVDGRPLDGIDGTAAPVGECFGSVDPDPQGTASRSAASPPAAAEERQVQPTTRSPLDDQPTSPASSSGSKPVRRI